MDIERIEFKKRLDKILGLVKALEIAIQEEPENLGLEDIKKLTGIVETELTDTINWLKS